jgi:hypothetical protein
MDNLRFEGDLRKSNASKSEQSNQTPLDAAANFIGDLTVNAKKNKETAQFQKYLATHEGKTPLGT